MNIAAIDIGSNTVLLLVVEVDSTSRKFKTIHNKYEAPRLGRGVKENGDISNESIEKLMNVLGDYSSIINHYNCEQTICTATNAMRVAKNSDRIKQIVKKEFDIDIEIIAGDREAELSYLGAATTLAEVKKKAVMDIGGGSTEIIYGENDNIEYKKSFPIGAVNLTEKYIENEIATETEINNLKERIKSVFEEIKNVIPAQTPLIAVAGTPTSLSTINMKLKEYDDKKVEGSILTIDVINNFIKEFSSITPKEILNRYGKIISGREDVILAGTLILNTVTEITINEKLYVSGRGIRYGSVVDYITKNL